MSDDVDALAARMRDNDLDEDFDQYAPAGHSCDTGNGSHKKKRKRNPQLPTTNPASQLLPVTSTQQGVEEQTASRDKKQRVAEPEPMDESAENSSTPHSAKPHPNTVPTAANGSALTNGVAEKQEEEEGDNVSEAESDETNIHVDNPEERSTAIVGSIIHINKRLRALDTKLKVFGKKLDNQKAATEKQFQDVGKILQAGFDDQKAATEKQFQDVAKVLQAGLDGLERRMNDKAGQAYNLIAEKLNTIGNALPQSSAPTATPLPAVATPAPAPAPASAPLPTALPTQAPTQDRSQVSVVVDITCEQIHGAEPFNKVVRIPCARAKTFTKLSDFIDENVGSELRATMSEGMTLSTKRGWVYLQETELPGRLSPGGMLPWAKQESIKNRYAEWYQRNVVNGSASEARVWVHCMMAGSWIGGEAVAAFAKHQWPEYCD